MARRRRAARKSSPLLVWAPVGLFVAASLWILLASLLQSNPILGILSIVTLVGLLGAGVGGFVWWRVRSRERYLARIATLNDLLLLTPTQFEYAVMELLRAWGYRDVRHTGGGGDLAADITCRTPDGAQAVVVQCKRYAPGHTVGSPEVQMFLGMLAVHHRAQVGIYVTTSSYTHPALALGRQHRLQMIDGNQLAAYIQQIHTRQQVA